MLVGLINTIFFLLIVYYAVKFVGRLILPYIMKKGFERMQQQQYGNNGSFQERTRRQEGKVTIKDKSEKKKSSHIPDTEGEYVDYEEVK